VRAADDFYLKIFKEKQKNHLLLFISFRKAKIRHPHHPVEVFTWREK